MDQAVLRLLIREKLTTGDLPHTHTPHVGGGPGSGETCDGCGETVTRIQMLMEGPLDAMARGVRLHVACFSVWDAERQVPGHEPSGPASRGQAACQSH